ncbi:MAG TPA: phage portal protein [Clostridia bacterium]|nr:phage portal protein [Clostridia bacterium]
MGFFGNIFGRKSKVDASEKAAKAASGGAASTPRRVSIRSSFLPHWLRGDYTLDNSDLIFSAVSRISNALSAMPMMLYQDARPKKGELSDLVGLEPNPSMTACQFFKTFEACRDTSGNGYALKIETPGRTLPYLYPLDPGRVRPIVEKGSRELWYRVTPEDGTPYFIHNYYILHVPFISTNGYIGVSPISVLNNTLQYQASIEEFSREQLKKGINAQVVLEAPASLGPKQKEDMIASFLETYKETGGNILLLESGVQAKSINLSPIDSKIFEVEKISRSRVANVYNIPPHMMGDFTDTSFTSQEQQMLEFLTLTMLPIVTAYEQEFTRKLVPTVDRLKGYRMRMNINNILRADASTMADVHQKGIRGGWIMPNEARAHDGLPPDKNGNKLLAARDLTTLEYIIQHPDNGKSLTDNGNATDPMEIAG